MTIFDLLLVSHLVGDFMLQTDSMAKNKVRCWPWMLRHVACYMVSITVGMVIYVLANPLPAWPVAVALLVIGVTHIILDRRGFTTRWMRLMGMTPEHPWLPIVVDQVFHILILAIVAQSLQFLTGSGGTSG